MMSSLSWIDRMLQPGQWFPGFPTETRGSGWNWENHTTGYDHQYNNARRKNDNIVLLKGPRKSKHSSKERLSHSGSLSPKMKKKR
jgi:hypothetical protein